MKLVAVDKALKELQNQSFHYTVVKTNANTTATGTSRCCRVKFTSYSALLNILLTKWVSLFLTLYLLILVSLTLEFAYIDCSQTVQSANNPSYMHDLYAVLSLSSMLLCLTCSTSPHSGLQFNIIKLSQKR